MTPTITTTAHTGLYAVQLGDNASHSIPAYSTISQTLTLSDSITATLSLLYRASVVNPMSSTLTVKFDGPTETLTRTLPLTGTDWEHIWWDIPTSLAPTLTVSIDLHTTDQTGGSVVVVDEISLGRQCQVRSRCSCRWLPASHLPIVR